MNKQLSKHTTIVVNLFVWFDFLHPINNLSVIQGCVFLGWTSTKLGLMCLAQGHNAVRPVRLEPSVSSQALYHWAMALRIDVNEGNSVIRVTYADATSNKVSLVFPCKWQHLLSADNVCRQFRPISDQTKRGAGFGSKLFDTLIVFPKKFYEKVNFEKVQQMTK